MGGLRGAASKQAENANVAKGGRLAALASRKPDPSKRWEFSFRFFKQIPYFGFDADAVEKTWFVSLMDRLAQLGKLTIDECISDPAKAQAYRLHPIDWKRKNVPIKREDLHWIEKDYLNDDENYPIRQFSVSTGLGRVVGFFDENHTFQIVLLDPMHNIQPSKHFAYAVDPCDPLDCELTQLQAAVEEVVRRAPPCGCELAGAITAALKRKTRQHQPTILLTPIEDHLLKDLSDAMEISGKSYPDIFKAGIETLI